MGKSVLLWRGRSNTCTCARVPAAAHYGAPGPATQKAISTLLRAGAADEASSCKPGSCAISGGRRAGGRPCADGDSCRELLAAGAPGLRRRWRRGDNGVHCRRSAHRAGHVTGHRDARRWMMPVTSALRLRNRGMPPTQLSVRILYRHTGGVTTCQLPNSAASRLCVCSIAASVSRPVLRRCGAP